MGNFYVIQHNCKIFFIFNLVLHLNDYAIFTQKYPDLVFRIEFFSIFANIIQFGNLTSRSHGLR